MVLPRWLAHLLILRSGDVEMNPGPLSDWAGGGSPRQRRTSLVPSIATEAESARYKEATPRRGRAASAASDSRPMPLAMHWPLGSVVDPAEGTVVWEKVLRGSIMRVVLPPPDGEPAANFNNILGAWLLEGGGYMLVVSTTLTRLYMPGHTCKLQLVSSSRPSPDTSEFSLQRRPGEEYAFRWSEASRDAAKLRWLDGLTWKTVGLARMTDALPRLNPKLAQWIEERESLPRARPKSGLPYGRNLMGWFDSLVFAAAGRGRFSIHEHHPLLAYVALNTSMAATARAKPGAVWNSVLRMHQLVEATGLGDIPGDAKNLAAFVLVYAKARVLTPKTYGWTPCSPASVRSELGRLRAVATDCGSTTEPYLSKIAKTWLTRVGASNAPLHSVKRPIHVADLLDVEPDAASPDRAAWECLLVQAFFCLRPGVARALETSNFAASEDGFVLTWKRRTKTRGSAHWREELKTPHCTAARHPALTKVLGPLLARSGGLFPTVTSGLANGFIARTLPANSALGFKSGAHGVRVGSDTELKHLGVSDDVLDCFGWWARKQNRSSSYYSGTSMQLMMAITEQLGAHRFTYTAPGAYLATPLRPFKSWAVLSEELLRSKGLPQPSPASAAGTDSDESDRGSSSDSSSSSSSC